MRRKELIERVNLLEMENERLLERVIRLENNEGDLKQLRPRTHEGFSILTEKYRAMNNIAINKF